MGTIYHAGEEYSFDSGTTDGHSSSDVTYESLWKNSDASYPREIVKEQTDKKITLYCYDAYIREIIPVIKSIFSNNTIVYSTGSTSILSKGSKRYIYTMIIQPLALELGAYYNYYNSEGLAGYNRIYRIEKINPEDRTLSSEDNRLSSLGFSNTDFVKGEIYFIINNS